ncbi:class E sortase [Lacisediminihabitans sp. H27-G8]|uniref:class E sortase n=1 Tax=Lacisediminihabitans sp. H27-G8 TaxID=3111909 RepID=UPI0038FC1183
MSEHRQRQADTLAPKRRNRVSAIGILGELFITAGVLVFLFLGWQLWLNDLIVGADQNKVGAALAQGWDAAAPTHEHGTTPGTDFGEPLVAIAPGDAVKFAVMYVPRFGADYARSISEGVETAKVLDKNGIGHYPGTQMPGQVGNFAVAAHRTTHGAPFKPLASLQVGDKIYVQTQDGYYTYEFRGLEYVRPTGVGVLDPVPQFAGVAPTDRILTMTSCNPMFSAAERIIAYASLESWQPTSAGVPSAISAAVTANS